MKKLRLFINGFGRIGRCIARAILERDDTLLVGVNDIANPITLTYLLQYDTAHGNAPFNITPINDNTYQIGTHKVTFSQKTSPKELELENVDIVIEATGLFLTQEDVLTHFQKGVKKVIFSAPTKDKTTTFVLGVNHSNYKGENIISNASCTTNCLAPIAMLLDKHFGIESGIITTIHSYTNDQQILDLAHKKGDLRRSRAAASNLIPTTTGAAKALHLVLPQLEGKLHGHSVRVPVNDVSLLDLNVYLHKKTTKEAINAIFQQAAQNELQGILGVDNSQRVSSDFLNCQLSGVVASDLTFVINDKMAKIMAWYDNEWGYSHRIVEMAHFISNYSN